MNRRNPKASWAVKSLALATALLGLSAAPAAAAPSFDIDLRREAHEVQLVTVKATAGQFRLSFDGSTTTDLAFDATDAQVRTALNALPSIGGVGGSVTVGLGGSPLPGGGGNYVTFDGGSLGNTDVPQMVASEGTTPLSGGFSTVRTDTLYPSGVTRADGSLAYSVRVRNLGDVPLQAGSLLSCDKRTWNGTPTSFAYQWLRDGAPIAGATTEQYTLLDADRGHSLQCRVTGTNATNGSTSSAVVSAPVVIPPVPAIPPPAPTAPTAASSRPTITPTSPTNALAGTLLTCNRPSSWSPLSPDPNAPTFTFQWLRNGSPIAGETNTTYTVAAADAGKVLQCQVLGSNGDGGLTSGGRAAGISLNRLTAGGTTTLTASITPANTVANTPLVTPAALVEVELPAGERTSVIMGTVPNSIPSIFNTGGVGWSCTPQPPAGAQPAEATCVSTQVVAPGASYNSLRVTARFGADAPDHAVARATAFGDGAAVPDSDTEEFDFAPAPPFDVSFLDSEVLDPEGVDYTQAGGHPFMGSTSFAFPTRTFEFGEHLRGPVENPKHTVLDLPRGFIGNALAVPELCPTTAQVLAATCPSGSVVGEVNADVVVASNFTQIKMPLYAIVPEFGAAAQFAFGETLFINTVYSITPRLRPDEGYAISLDPTPLAFFPALRRLNWGTLCSFGAHVSDAGGSTRFAGCKEATDPTANPIPLITNPTRCSGAPPALRLRASSWLAPEDFKTKESVDPQPTGCEKIDFLPEASFTPTNNQADAPTGVDVEIRMDTEGLQSPTREAQSMLDNVIVRFPLGMSVNPAAAHGLSSCTPAQIKLGSNDPHQCPLSSQVGTIEIETPLIRNSLRGSVFVASQRDNPFDSNIGLYMVFSSPRDGITIKIAGRLDADPVTGQLTSTFVENPEWPFSKLNIRFNSGPRAPLINPPRCGTYAIHTELSPWSAADPANPTAEEIVEDDSVYEVSSGPNGAPCPSGALEPGFEAGVKNATAGAKSPFVMKLTREDGGQRFTGIDLDMPQGLVAYLKGVAYCPDSTLNAISEAELTGRPELASPACPANSQVGSVQAGAGVGPYPFYAQGRAFLAGPYKGAPLSIAVVTPAVAGPFDLGNVVVRNAVFVDPKTAEVTVRSDPIPTMLHGLMLNVKDLRVNIDREGFIAAPTSCDPMSIGAQIAGADGATANLSNRFQVGECAALGFKPRMTLKLRGGTKRGKHPALTAILEPRSGDANIANISVALPRSEFLENAHIRTVCTRPDFAADRCPAGAIYGRATVFTPLLDEPLTGPVYLRSSNNLLPDLVPDLRGTERLPLRIESSGRTDSINGGIRNTFDFVPDAPFTKFILRMQGGRKGLLVNSRDICRRAYRATVKAGAHNGRRITLRPKLKAPCGKKAAKRAKRRAHQRGR